jgi:hypothetical protein
MAKGVILAFSNPVSAEREDEYNKWYSGIHKDEICALDGVIGVTRYRTSEVQAPGSGSPPFKYLTIYELSDVATVFPAMAALKLTRSDAIDPKSSLVIFEPFLEYRKP